MSLGNILRDAKRRDLSALGLAFDSADNVTLFVAFLPGTCTIWDLPPIEKCTLPIGEQEQAEPAGGSARDDDLRGLVAEGLNLRAPKSTPTSKRGLKSIELLQMIEQQVRMLYKCTFMQFAHQAHWHVATGGPLVTLSPSAPNPDLPRTLVIVTDQGGDIQLTCALLKHIGIRCIPIADHNHRDDNDAKCTTELRIAIEMISKCTYGPYHTGVWFKSMNEAAACILADEELCTK